MPKEQYKPVPEVMEEEKVYLLHSGGAVAAPSIDGPYSKKRAEEILEADKENPGPAANSILTAEEAKDMLRQNPDRYENNTDIDIAE